MLPTIGLSPVLDLLLANRHLLVGLKERHLGELGMQLIANARHLGVVPLTDLIEGRERILFEVAAPIEPPLELGELEVAIDRVRICSQ